MSKVIQAVIGVAEVVVGAFVPGFQFMIAAGVATLLNVAAQLLVGQHRPPVSPIDVNYAGTLEPRMILYGQLKTGGMHVVPPMTSGSNNDMLHIVLAIVGHAVDSFGDVYLGQTRIAKADVGSPVTNLVTNNGYQGKVWIRLYDGTQTTVDSILNTTFTVWDANHKGLGIAYMAIQLQYDQAVFASGLPQPSVVVKGKRIYDPRLDSTNGGSGSQRYTDSTTWTYSTNPALCLRDYLTSALGLGEAQTRIDDSLVSAAANICDQQVSVPIPILVGLTNWQAGSALVGGVNTAFMAGINNGQFTQSGSNWLPTVTTYVLAPNGSMLQVASVQSDTQFTLSAAYGGATISSQVTQWNNSASTTTTQARYTSNVMLDSTARYEDNIVELARAMMGQCIYSGGMWRIYAGAWTGSAFSLAESDLVGSISIQCATPRQTLYNAVRGNFINPQQNYQPSEIPPVINTAFATEDGETIYTETNFPCCTDTFECQRNANLLINFSRDQKIATAQFGMSAFGVKVWEIGTVTINEIGWVNQTVRCIGWRFQPKGLVELTLQEAYQADFTDPPVGFYVTHGTLVANYPGFYLPYSPTGLTTKTVPNGIEFSVALPSQVAPGTRIQLWQYSANTPFSSATLLYTGSTTDFSLFVGDTITRYYWVTTLGPNGQQSAQYPAGNGVAGTGGTIDNSIDGSTYARTKGSGLTSGYATKTGAAGAFTIKGVGDAQTLGLDGEIADGPTYYVRMPSPPAVSGSGGQALAQNGTTTAINVAAGTYYLGNKTVSVNAGSVDPGAYGTYWIYFDDPGFGGGAVTYQAIVVATGNYVVITQSPYRFFVGSIGTTGSGGATGGGTRGPCFSGDTRIRTPYGYRRFDELPERFEIVNRTGRHHAALLKHHEEAECRRMGPNHLVTAEHRIRVGDDWLPARELFYAEGPKGVRDWYNLHVFSDEPDDHHYILENGLTAHNPKP